MSFLSPWALALSALAVPIVALYFLKLRREERTVSSTYLWRSLVRDTAANVPWQRLRPNVLLFLQLAALAAIVLALARPYIWSDAVAGDHVILVLDTSASMQATDVRPNRLEAAVRAARQLVARLPAGARGTVIGAGGWQDNTEQGGTDGAGGLRAEVLASGTADRDVLYRALDRVRPAVGGSDLSAALEMAAAIAARERDPETVVFSDGNVQVPEHMALPGRVRYVPIGSAASNQGIVAFSLQAGSGGQSYSAFLQVASQGEAPAERRLTLTADGRILAARTLRLSPGELQPLVFDDLSAAPAGLEARLEGSDALALDDVAWAVPPGGGQRRVDLVSAGNRFLETALGLVQGLEVTVVKPADYASAGQSVDLTIFDGAPSPAPLPPGGLLFLAPLQSSAPFSVTGVLTAPATVPARGDEPLLRYVDVRGLNVAEAARVPRPAWARSVLVAGNSECPAPGGGDVLEPCPLVLVGERDGQRVAAFTFDLRQSDLPLRVAFPLLLANLLDYFAADSIAGGVPATVRPGQAVTLPMPPGAEALLVTRPDGQVDRVDVAGGRPTYAATDLPGVYGVQSGVAAGASSGYFAVNLFDPQESAIAVQNVLALPGSEATGDRQETQRLARQEWWRPLAWLALLVLTVEWLYAHRGQVAELYARAFPKSRPVKEP